MTIRPGRDSDLSLVRDSFWRAFAESPFANGVPARVLLARLDWLLALPRWKLAVAHPSDNAEVIFGWVLHEPGAPHVRVAWISVVPSRWGQGIASALARHAGIDRRGQHVECAFLDPRVQQRVRDTHGIRLHFRPYLPDIALLDARTAELAAAAVVQESYDGE